MTHQRAGLGERSVATIGRVHERLAKINARFAIMVLNENLTKCAFYAAF